MSFFSFKNLFFCYLCFRYIASVSPVLDLRALFLEKEGCSVLSFQYKLIILAWFCLSRIFGPFFLLLM